MLSKCPHIISDCNSQKPTFTLACGLYFPIISCKTENEKKTDILDIYMYISVATDGTDIADIYIRSCNHDSGNDKVSSVIIVQTIFTHALSQYLRPHLE